MANHTRFVHNRLEQFRLNYPDIHMAWIQENVSLDQHGELCWKGDEEVKR